VDAAATPGTATMAAPTGPVVSTTRSALVWWRSCATPEAVNDVPAAALPTTRPTSTMSGAATDALRRRAVHRFARARAPVTPAPVGISRPTSGTTNGPRAARATAAGIATFMAMAWPPSAPPCGATMTIASTPPAKTIPASHRLAVITRAASPVSRNASSGRTRPARRAATSTPVTASARPVPTETPMIHGRHWPVKPAGTKPSLLISRDWMAMAPSPAGMPMAAPRPPSSTASPSSSRRT